jgi:uncharacterized protein DUF3800
MMDDIPGINERFVSNVASVGLHQWMLAMLRAYFDDSGTHTGGKHGPSKIVLVAGIFGTEGRMDGLDRMWKKRLASPIRGQKARLNRFHASDCYQSKGEFEGWTRTETDYFRQQLRETIIESGVAAYGMACSRKDWDEIITGDMRAVIGDPEVQDNTFDPHMTFVFDNRPDGVRRYAGAVYDAFAQWLKPPPALAGYAFLSSTQNRPLQAADLVAWETYQYANNILKNGINTPAQPEVLHLQKNGFSSANCAS